MCSLLLAASLVAFCSICGGECALFKLEPRLVVTLNGELNVSECARSADCPSVTPLSFGSFLSFSALRRALFVAALLGTNGMPLASALARSISSLAVRWSSSRVSKSFRRPRTARRNDKACVCNHLHKIGLRMKKYDIIVIG